MATITSIANKIQNEILRANEVTNLIDTNLHDAITHLIAGYGNASPTDPTEPLTGFTIMEYLESSGLQYINTGYCPNTNSKFILDGNWTTTPTVSKLFGSGSPYIYIQSNDIARFGNSGDLTITNNDPLVRKVYELSKDGISVNNVKIDNTMGSFATSSTARIYLFSVCDINRNPSSKACGRIYSFKIYEGNELIMDLVPAMRNEDQILGMYDKVNHTFLTNSGSGTFSSKEAEV